MNRLDPVTLIKPELSEQSVCLFLIRLDSFVAEDLIMNLSSSEKDRANTLKIEKKKNQFIVTRAILRQLLGNSLGLRPRDITIHYSQHGKPWIDNTIKDKTVEFNVSHSGNYAYMTIGLKNRSGIDIEAINQDINPGPLVERFFSAQERKAFFELDKAERAAAFYAVWSRKESFIKATGDGVSFGLERFSVPVLNDNYSSKIVTIQETKEEWFLYDLVAPEGYKAALSSSASGLDIIMSQII